MASCSWSGPLWLTKPPLIKCPSLELVIPCVRSSAVLADISVRKKERERETERERDRETERETEEIVR